MRKHPVYDDALSAFMHGFRACVSKPRVSAKVQTKNYKVSRTTRMRNVSLAYRGSLMYGMMSYVMTLLLQLWTHVFEKGA